MNSSLILYLLVGVFTFLFGFSPPVSAAVTISITNAPSSAVISEELSVTFTADGLEANTQYYGKIRLGIGGTYTKGETKNGDTWLGDTDSWTSFPILTTDSSGGLNSVLTGRAKSTAALGENQLFVRLRKVGASTNVSPDGATTVTFTQSATPTPTPSPTPVPTNTPVPTTAPTPTPVKTPTPTPTPKYSSTGGSGATVTLKPTSPPTSVPTKILALSSQAEGGSGNISNETTLVATLSPTSQNLPTKKPTPIPIKSGQTAILGVAQSNLSKILIGLGIIFLAACGIIAFRSFRKEDKITL